MKEDAFGGGPEPEGRRVSSFSRRAHLRLARLLVNVLPRHPVCVRVPRRLLLSITSPHRPDSGAWGKPKGPTEEVESSPAWPLWTPSLVILFPHPTCARGTGHVHLGCIKIHRHPPPAESLTMVESRSVTEVGREKNPDLLASGGGKQAPELETCGTAS